MQGFYVNPNRTREVWVGNKNNDIMDYIVVYWAVNGESALVWPLAFEREGDPHFMSRMQILNRGYKKYEKK